MRKIFKFIILSTLFVSPAHIIAQTIDLQIVDSLTNEPIENVYVYNNGKEFLSVSDKNGVCKIVLPTSTLTTQFKEVNVSHIGYAAKVIETKSLISNNFTKVLLSPTSYELHEVAVIPPNVKNIIEKAIENIPKNYPPIQGDTLALDVNFTFLDNPNSKIADYNGKIALTSNGKHLLAAKYATENNLISNSFYDYNNEISPGGFYSIIFIQNHAPIRLSKKMDFHYDGIITNQGHDTYKISFIRKSKYNNISGYMLINTNDYAITYITYEMGEIKKWIAATHKSMGIVYTNLEKYKVCVSYIEDIKGYQFSDGAINMLFNRTKKEKVLSNNTYDVSFKATKTSHIPTSLTYLKANELFKTK
jgi:hypothetical protein